MPARPDRVRWPLRWVTLVGSLIALAALSTSALLASGAVGGASHERAWQQRIAARTAALSSLETSIDSAPITRTAACAKTVGVLGQGRSCRTTDGMWLVPRRSGAPIATHGPDIVAAAPRSARAGGFGTTSAVICSAPSQTRYVALAYLLPADFAAGAASGAHGDRFTDVAPQLRQSLLDAATLVDARAGELAPGTHRRMRVLCDDDGQPRVERIVLPHTSAEYRASSGGFGLMLEDLERAGHLPAYAAYASERLPAVKRLLGYYDAEFVDGYAGQATMYRRASLLTQGVRASDPLISRTVRNINNNPPSASFAVQYGTNLAGVPDPPLYTSLLHELSHTMGAVQNEPPTSSDGGHCTDGLDLMCYDDGGPTGTYVDTACADPAPPAVPEDERFDCNGDTYFHPAPPAGSPLTDPTTWQLGLPANQTLSTTASAPIRPPAVTQLRAPGVAAATRRTMRWAPVAGARGYEIGWRTGSAEWQYAVVARPPWEPMLRGGLRYELVVGAIGADGVLGPRAARTLTTGVRDDTPPSIPGGVQVVSVARTSARLSFELAADNVRVTRYVVERLQGGRWVRHVLLAPPSGADVAAGDEVTSPPILRLAAGARTRLRMRALDARGNASAPSRSVLVVTRR